MKALAIFLRVIAIAAMGVLAAPFLWEAATDDYLMTVTGRSMEPTYEIGDVLIVQPPVGDELEHVGQIVVVSFNPGEKESQYVHRVVEVTPDGTILQGDGNTTPDPTPLTAESLMGTPRVALTGTVADAYHLTQNPWMRVSIAALVLAALLVPVTSRRKHKSDEVLDSAAETDEMPILNPAMKADTP